MGIMATFVKYYSCRLLQSSSGELRSGKWTHLI